MVTILTHTRQEHRCIASLPFVFNPKALPLDWQNPPPPPLQDRLGFGFVCQPPLFLFYFISTVIINISIIIFIFISLGPFILPTCNTPLVVKCSLQLDWCFLSRGDCILGS